MISFSILQEQSGPNLSLKTVSKFVLTKVAKANALRKIWLLLELQMFRSNLFHSPIICGKKKSIPFSKEIHGKGWGGKLWICDGYHADRNLQSKHNCFIFLLCWRYSIPYSWYNLSRDEALMTPVVAYAWFNIVWKWCIWRLVINSNTITKMRCCEGFVNDQ